MQVYLESSYPDILIMAQEATPMIYYLQDYQII